MPRQLPAPERIPGADPGPDALTRLRASTESLAAVTIPALGTADHGTRALARYWAHRSAADFPDGQLHLDLGDTDPAGPLDPSDGLRAALLALGLPEHLVPPGLDRRSAWFRRLLNGKRVLILLENARAEHQVRRFLPDSAGTLLLVTAPSRLDSLAANHGAVPLTPERLTEAESLVLLTAYLGADGIADDPAAARRLITRCGHRRLTLGILAAQAFRHPGTTLDGLLPELDTVSGRRVDGGVQPGGASADDVESAALSLCYQGLSGPAAAMLRSFGLVDGPDLGVDALAALLGRAPEDLSAPLRELVAATLIGEHHPGRYRCPAPVRRFALDTSRRTDSAADRRSARHRLLRYYQRAADAYRTEYRVPGADSLLRQGQTALAGGDLAQARESFQQAESRYLDRSADRLAEVRSILADPDEPDEPRD